MGATRGFLSCAYFLALLSLASAASAANALPKCFFVSSDHKGYAWSDSVEVGLRSAFRGKCELRQFDMNTKRRDL